MNEMDWGRTGCCWRTNRAHDLRLDDPNANVMDRPDSYSRCSRLFVSRPGASGCRVTGVCQWFGGGCRRARRHRWRHCHGGPHAPLEPAGSAPASDLRGMSAGGPLGLHGRPQPCVGPTLAPEGHPPDMRWRFPFLFVQRFAGRHAVIWLFNLLMGGGSRHGQSEGSGGRVCVEP